MTIELNDLLVVFVYTSLIILIVVMIVLLLKLMKTIKKVNIMFDDVSSKLNKLDSAFDVINTTSSFTNKILRSVICFLSKERN